MSFDPQFLEMLTAIVTFKPTSSVDGYGQATLGSSVKIPARIVYKTVIVRGNTEENATSTAQIVIPPPGYAVPEGKIVPTVTVSSHFTLPDGVDRRVLDVTVPCDESGTPHHQKVSLT